ncbi:MAG: hypothetical protein WC523_03445 [Patescibacteria group bacterium]
MKSTLISKNCPELVLIEQLREVKTVEQRSEINSKIREMLKVVDNGIIVYAAIFMNHDLSFRELRKRVNGEHFNDLGELFDLMDKMYNFSHGQSYNKLFSLTRQRIIQISKSKPTEEIVNIVKEYGSNIHILGDDTPIVDDMLAGRNDLEEIANNLSSQGFNPEELSLTLRNRPKK